MFEFIITHNTTKNNVSIPSFTYKNPQEHSERFFRFHDIAIHCLSFKNDQDYSEDKYSFLCIYGSIYYLILDKRKGAVSIKYLLNNINLLENPQKNFRGNYAIIYYDKKNNILKIINDPLGLKPIYYGNIDNSIYIASSLDIIKKITNRIDESALLEKLIFNYNISKKTIYKDIFTLENGESLTLNKNKIIKTKYFSILDIALNGKNGKYSLEEFRTTFNKIVLNRGLNHQKILISLTAGNDGRAVVSAANNLGIPYDTFSFGKKGGENTLIPERIASLLQFNHTSIYLNDKFEKNYYKNAFDTINLSDGNLSFEQQSTLYSFNELSNNSYDNKIFTGLLAGETIGPIHLKHDYFNEIYFKLIYQQEKYSLSMLKEIPFLSKLVNHDFIEKNYEELFYSIKSRQKFINTIRNSRRPHLFYYLDLIELGFRKFYGSQMHLIRYYSENIPVFYDLDIFNIIFNTNFNLIFKNSFENILLRWKGRFPQSYITSLNYPAIAALPLDRGFTPSELIHPLKRYLTFIKYYQRKFIYKKKYPDFDSPHWCKNLLNNLFIQQLEDTPYFNKNEMIKYISNLSKNSGNYSIPKNRIISDYIFINS